VAAGDHLSGQHVVWADGTLPTPFFQGTFTSGDGTPFGTPFGTPVIRTGLGWRCGERCGNGWADLAATRVRLAV
jgi:hypothetical protein